MSGDPVVLARLIGSGGEATVHETVNLPNFVAKIYHPAKRTHEREMKLKYMIANPPFDDGRANSQVPFAWPADLLTDNRRFVGFLMPRLSGHHEISTVLNPATRRAMTPNLLGAT